MANKLLERFTKINCNQFRVDKVLKKVINYMSIGKVTIICLIVGLISNILLYNVSQYFPPDENSVSNI